MISHPTPFELFLEQHEQSLSTVVMSRPLPRAMMFEDTTARIIKGQRKHTWTPMLGGIDLKAAEIQRAAEIWSATAEFQLHRHWTNCRYKHGYCFAANQSRRYTMQKLEEAWTKRQSQGVNYTKLR